jgi:hypothetical protein
MHEVEAKGVSVETQSSRDAAMWQAATAWRRPRPGTEGRVAA